MTDALVTATFRLGLMLSVVAAGVAAGLSLIGDVSTWSLAFAVATIGFIASWNQTGRIAAAQHDRVPVLASEPSVRRSLG